MPTEDPAVLAPHVDGMATVQTDSSASTANARGIKQAVQGRPSQTVLASARRMRVLMEMCTVQMRTVCAFAGGTAQVSAVGVQRAQAPQMRIVFEQLLVRQIAHGTSCDRPTSSIKSG